MAVSGWKLMPMRSIAHALWQQTCERDPILCASTSTRESQRSILHSALLAPGARVVVAARVVILDPGGLAHKHFGAFGIRLHTRRAAILHRWQSRHLLVREQKRE